MFVFYNFVMKNFDKNQKNDVSQTIVHGDCFRIIKNYDSGSFNCVLTSPPYFREREKNKHFNLNQNLDEYIDKIVEISREIFRVLKDDGSYWLNLGDAYIGGSLALIPSRVALKLIEDGWILNNDVIWSKSSSTPSSYSKRLTNSYEHLFHFVKKKDFYYNITALDGKKKKPKVVNGTLLSSSGVSGKKYKKIIEDSSSLNKEEKQNALEALEECIKEVSDGTITDYRFLIRGSNKITSKNRIDEANRKGFVVIKSKESKPTDVWEIMPEKKSMHYAAFPEDIPYFPILVSCPPHGVVLDPFCGSGTTNFVCKQLKRSSVGIEWQEEFAEYANKRCK